MPAATPSTLGLLEIIALLFPVVALLLQLQHRAADSESLQRLGFVSAISLLLFLAFAFALIVAHVLLSSSPPLLLVGSMLLTTGVSLLIPILVALSTEGMTPELSHRVGWFGRVRPSRLLVPLPWRGANRVEENDDQD